ncbi:MAG: ATP-binding protein [Proteobacteria bacterium]|nr:ATP-binding protein [Pseudomonadota bacterium]
MSEANESRGSVIRRWLATPKATEVEATHKARLMVSVLRTMGLMASVGLVSSLLDRNNNPLINLAFYGPIFVAILGMHQMVKRGRLILVGWVSSLFFWALIAFVTLFFGGLKGGNATAFGVCTMLVGGLVSGRAAIMMAIGSSAWCALVALLEIRDALPPPLGPYTPINAWTAITLSLLLISVLLRASIEAMRAVHQQAVAAATERDAVLRRSIQSQKMELVGNLASGVAHDFNNLLMVIRGATDALREDLVEGRPLDGTLLDELDAASDRATLMTRQLLSFGRAQPTEATEVDIGALVSNLGPMLPRLLGSKIAVDIQVVPDAIALASRVGIEQVLLNLAVNARDAMPTGGRLGLRVVTEADHVSVLVEDNGVRMNDELKAQVFTPFFTTKASGTGLGLATVRTALERVGGTISLTSQLGVGTTFEIRLARVTPSA